MTQRCSLSDWKLYFGDRLKKDHPLGFVVIVPVTTADPIPIECPVCGMMMCSSDDAEYFRQKKCCSRCGMLWADPNLSQWHAGWRPDAHEVQEDVARRRETPVVLSQDTLSR
jgi:tRNA(Ile2) C34 agmatinyltransferase TiaS